MDEKKASMYIVAIVGVVAAVGILVLLMGAGISENMTGQAYIKLKAKDDAAGLVETSSGQQVSGTATVGKGTETPTCDNPNRPFCALCNCCVTTETCDGY
ncbi:hypothetical protein HZC31_05650 [Candidatus Woesearchaeota archaeon]|nr:hypothetical protein [Candidatus Woesearchaeota archaeon]